MKRAFKGNIEIPPAWRLRHFEAIDEKGAFISPVVDVMWDTEAGEPRYVLLEVGGGVGVTGKRVLLPVKMVVRLGAGQIQTLCSQQAIFDAPRARNEENPSRGEEEEIFQYYDISPYWLDETGLGGEKAEAPVKAKKPLPPPPDVNFDDLKLEKDTGKNGH